MPWDTWALLSIIALCTVVIARTCWDSYRLDHEPRRTTLRLPLSTGGHLEIAYPPTHPPGRHRAPSTR
ncbi:hypothetical protein GPX89_09715 [Nocardia sp. ET3-3]|uniref:Uncharacterized protein n=1 Tax=Nocardia terrae TaxID=2675851 RepID=A0A7K1UT40_9NOCA|nr:hypothetical protein [Nocardia terrae]MVU77522.1 hypothetical protein [Nocardia terrae]